MVRRVRAESESRGFERARSLLTLEERVAVDDLEEVVRDAVAAWQAMRAQPEVTAVLGGGDGTSRGAVLDR